MYISWFEGGFLVKNKLHQCPSFIDFRIIIMVYLELKDVDYTMEVYSLFKLYFNAEKSAHCHNVPSKLPGIQIYDAFLKYFSYYMYGR